jgi:RES domain-containing protein
VLAKSITHPIEGIFYRSIPAGALYKFDPPQPLWSLGPGMSGQRFTPIGGPPALYVAESPQTTLYEGNSLAASLFAHVATRPAIPATVTISVRAKLLHVLDLSDESILETLGLTQDDLFCAWKELMLKGLEVPTHTLADVAYGVTGLQAIRFPSNQDATGVNLVIWTRKIKSPCYIEVDDPSGTLWQRVPKVSPTKRGSKRLHR